MRKLHKKQILDLLETLGNVLNNAKNLFLNGQIKTLINTLADCQDGAANISEFIKQIYGENAQVEQLLTEFTEMLYKASVEINENKAENNFTEHLKKQLNAIENCVKNELKPNKIEVAFLPYKASMWDSLESIYLTAKDDPACEAFVMPIPYYDLKNGKFTEMHWETNYPKNIPLTDYRKYNIEERHPDIIFIHNPYDGYNVVTSVHPDFYSEKLRNLTDCLVYVPYFVGNGIHLQEHFCTLPACIFAHKVIVQTEKEREIYVRVYKEFAKKNGTPERFDKIGDKFLALGSPKLDKAVSTKSENCEIPEEWKKLIGTKKVVFYNTSIAALLENSVEDNKPSNKYLQKVRSVFEFFKKREDAVLLWRPHPLLEGTIKSMRPWLEQEYAEIVREYKNEGYGIYDDTEDLNRSIAISDVYYGDGSSVMKLFDTAGKPVSGQVFGVIPQPVLAGLYDDGIFVWFIDCYGMLYRHNKQNKETEYIGISGLNWRNLQIAINNKKLYFAPYFKNDKISIFDMDKKCFEQMPFKDDCKYDRKFGNLVCFKNFIYFIPQEFPAIMRLNTNTNEIEYFSDWLDDVSKLPISKLQEGWKNIKFWGFCVANEEIAIVVKGINAIMFFNMETGNYEIKSIGEKSEQYFSVCFDGQNYYLSSLYNDYIVKWNRQSNKISKIKIPSFSRKESIGHSFLIQYLNEYVWLFPVYANNAYKINVNTDEITELPELIEHFENKNLNWHYNIICASENMIYASTQTEGIVEYNTNTSELNFIRFNFAADPWLLSLLYDYDNRKSELKTNAEAGNFGGKIWEHLKGVMP